MSTSTKIELIEDGNATSGWRSWVGGVGTFAVAGNLNGATVALQMMLPDQTTPYTVGDPTTLTAPGAANFELGACEIRALVSGGSPVGVYAQVNGVAY